ncbi:MAG: DUF1499 domain-containing protein [Rhodothermales bacterium]
MPTDLPENPLPPCPDVPNCVRETRHFKVSSDKLFSRALKALYSIKPTTVEVDEDAHRIDAVFRVVLFKDDVVLRVEPDEAGAVVHIRSESRLGRGDLGVNRRRVDRFFSALGEEVKA